MPRLIQDELRRGLGQYTSSVSAQLASRLDKSPVDTYRLSSMMTSRAYQSTSAEPITALQLLHRGQVGSAFEMVKSLLSFCFSVYLHSELLRHNVYVKKIKVVAIAVIHLRATEHHTVFPATRHR